MWAVYVLVAVCLVLLALVGHLISERVGNPISPVLKPSKRLLDRAQVHSLVQWANSTHQEYEHDRVHVRKRAGWSRDQRIDAVAQRVMREVYRLGLEADYEEVKKIVTKETA